MKKLLYASLFLAASLSGCRHNGDSPAPALSDELAGTWRLISVVCFCPGGQPVPDEVLTLDTSQHFQLFRNGTLAATGTYATSQKPNCSASDSAATLTLTAPTAKGHLPTGAYRLQNNSLVIDQCSAADGPQYTYQRQ